MEIRMNKEIRDYKETTFGIFTLRQGLCVGAMCGAAVLVNFRLRNWIDPNLMIFVYAAVAVPFLIIGDFFGGFFKKSYGVNTFGFVKILLNHLFAPRRLKYVGRNVLTEMKEEIRKEEERRERLEKIKKIGKIGKGKAHYSKNCAASNPDSNHMERRHISKRKNVQ